MSYGTKYKVPFKSISDADYEIASKEKELTSISEALKLAELKQDLEELNKNIFSNRIS